MAPRVVRKDEHLYVTKLTVADGIDATGITLDKVVNEGNTTSKTVEFNDIFVSHINGFTVEEISSGGAAFTPGSPISVLEGANLVTYNGSTANQISASTLFGDVNNIYVSNTGITLYGYGTSNIANITVGNINLSTINGLPPGTSSGLANVLPKDTLGSSNLLVSDGVSTNTLPLGNLFVEQSNLFVPDGGISLSNTTGGPGKIDVGTIQLGDSFRLTTSNDTLIIQKWNGVEWAKRMILSD